jgi:hypothetical protein
MSTHAFTLILSGVAEITPELADALYEATEGDIEFNMRNGVAFMECEREGESLQDAVTSVVRAVEEAEVGVRVVRVESGQPFLTFEATRGLARRFRSGRQDDSARR